METRLKFSPHSGVYQAMLALETYVRKSSGLEPSLLELVRMRASQINGCAFCLDMHSKDARAEGETEQRLYCLPAWRETPFYSEREQAALAWTEAVTLASEEPCAGRSFRACTQAFLRRGIDAIDSGDRGHQRLEPFCHFIPRRSRSLPAGNRWRSLTHRCLI